MLHCSLLLNIFATQLHFIKLLIILKTMKMKLNYFLFSQLLFIALIFSACSEEDVDVTDPTVSNILLNDLSEDIQVNPGSTMHFDAVFSDDVRLGEFKVDIHDNFDGHGHGRILSTVAWDTTFIVELIGKTQTVHEDIEIPANAATGPYHFNLQYFDDAGNEGELMTIEFEIVDPAAQPSIIITSPSPDAEYETTPGASFTLMATVADPDGLDEIHVELMEADEDHDHGRLTSEEALWEKEWDLSGESLTEMSIEESIMIPASAELGHYELKIKAKDKEGNYKVSKIEVHIE